MATTTTRKKSGSKKRPTLSDFPPDKLKLLIHGDPGTGKTTLAASIAEKCVTAYLDMPGEFGIDSIRYSPYTDQIIPKRINSADDLYQAFWDIQEGNAPFEDAQAVIIESVGSMQMLFLREELGLGPNELEDLKKKRGDARRLYGPVVDHMKEQLTLWYGLADGSRDRPLHVIMTAQSRMREDRDEDTEALLERWKGPDVSPGSRNAVESNPNYIGYCAIEEKENEEEVSEEGEEEYVYTVRFGPHPTFTTKIRRDVHLEGSIPSVMGRKSRLTIPKFCRAVKVPLP